MSVIIFALRRIVKTTINIGFISSQIVRNIVVNTNFAARGIFIAQITEKCMHKGCVEINYR